MSENRNTDKEFARNILKGLALMKSRADTTNEEYFRKLEGYGIHFSEERIINDYARVRDIRKLDDSYYEQYGEILDRQDKDRLMNSDVFMTLMNRTIPQHFDFTETGDPYFIESAIDDLCRKDLRKTDQKEIEKVLRALVAYSETRDHHTLDDILEMFDLNGLLKELVSVCHDRNTSFRNLIRKLYECYEDMDPKIFPSVYREKSRK